MHGDNRLDNDCQGSDKFTDCHNQVLIRCLLQTCTPYRTTHLWGKTSAVRSPYEQLQQNVRSSFSLILDQKFV